MPQAAICRHRLRRRYRVIGRFKLLLIISIIMSGACQPMPEGAAIRTQSPGVSDKEILIGASLALKGHAGYLGTQMLHGAISHIRHINAHGGFHGRRIRVIAYKEHIDQLIGKLRTTFWGFISVVVVILFAISHVLARYITRPITPLTRLSDDISRGRFDFAPEPSQDNRSWEMKACRQEDCRAYANTELPCWYLDANPVAEEIYGYRREELVG
jgi:hypothetical protein